MLRVLILASALVGVATPAAAQGSDPRPWSVSFSAGTSPSISGLYHEGGNGTVLTLPTIVEERSWSDIYNSGFAMKVGVGYFATERVEVTGTFQYLRQDAEELSVGTVAALDLRSDFGEYRDWGLEGGIRYHFAPTAPVDFYLGGAVGARWVDAKHATLTVPAAGVVLPDVPFYDDSVAPTFGADFGVQFAAAPAVRLGAEAGVRWIGSLQEIEGLAGTGLENLNDSSSRWIFPIMGTIAVRF